MPGFSAECQGGIHASCGEQPGQCRCICHSHTQELMKAGPKKPDGKGGLRRKLKANVTAKVADVARQLPERSEVIPEESLEVKNTCPKCKTVAGPSDVFCRKDGTKLCLGKPCERCSAPCDEPDVHCWACGWKLGETLPVRTLDPLPTPGLSLDRTSALPPGTQEILESRHSAPQPGQVEIQSAESTEPVEDPLLRLRRLAQSQGLLPPGTVAVSR